MEGSQQNSPTDSTPVPHSTRPSISPAIMPQDSRNHEDPSSPLAADNRHYSFINSSTTSPALGASSYEYAYGISTGSALTSPALQPQREMDHEASAALLMLNSDRRGTGARGMSVKDLLSS